MKPSGTTVLGGDKSVGRGQGSMSMKMMPVGWKAEEAAEAEKKQRGWGRGGRSGTRPSDAPIYQEAPEGVLINHVIVLTRRV